MDASNEIARGRTFDESRTRWHLLFVTDTKEIVTRGGEERVTVFDEAMLRSLVSNRKMEIRVNGERGTVFQPKPVSDDHKAARRIYYGEDVGDYKRRGNDLDLYYHEGSDGAPAGTYSLVEWTPSAWAEIESGESMTISPTTVKDDDKTDGLIVRGLSIQEIGLVDVPQLDSIGTTRDGLAWDAFGEDATDARPREAEPAATRRVPTWRGATSPEGVVMRGAIHIEPVDLLASNTEGQVAEENAETAPATGGDAVVTRMISGDELKDMLSGMFAELRDAIVAAVGADTAAAEPEGDAAGDGEEEGDGAEARSAAPVEPTLEELEAERIDANVRQLVKDGALLASRAAVARQRLKEGEGVSDLLGDYTIATLRSKTVVAAAETVPAEAGVKRTSITENEILDEAEALPECRSRSGAINHVAVARKAAEIRTRYVAEGVTVTTEAV